MSLSISNSEWCDLKKFFKKLSWFLPAPLFILGVNFFVDPANLYHTQAATACVATSLAEGFNVKVGGNVDHRRMALMIIDHLKFRPEISVFGSSRTYEIGRNIFPNGKIHNSSVTEANLEDYLDMFDEYSKTVGTPKVLILGLDPWVLNKESIKSVTWLGFSSYENYFQKAASRNFFNQARILKKISNLFSMSYFKASLKLLGTPSQVQASRSQICAPTQATSTSSGYLILTDGRRIYDEQTQTRPLEAVQSEAQIYANLDRIGFESFEEMNPTLVNLFESFLQHVANQGTRILFYLPAYHPLTYASLINRNDTRVIVSVERYFRDLALKNGIPVLGSYDPAKYGVDAKDFIDAAHLHPMAVEKLFRKENIPSQIFSQLNAQLELSR